MDTMQQAARAIVAKWVSLQVELQDQFPLHRMGELRRYWKRTSRLRATAVCLLTPLPVLALLVIIESIPLDDPTGDVYNNDAFWIRLFISGWFMSIGGIHPFHICVPHLRSSYCFFIMSTVAATSIGTLTVYVFSLWIGFPLPFAMVFITATVAPSVFLAYYNFFGESLRQDHIFRQDLYRYFRTFLCMNMLPVIYPILIFFFYSVDPSQRAVFAMIFPLSKLFLKNVMSQYLVNADGMKAVVIVFTVDVFNALYVSICMQVTADLKTTAAVMVIDAIQLGISIYDVYQLVADLRQLAEVMESKATKRIPERSRFIDLCLELLAVNTSLKRSGTAIRGRGDARVCAADMASTASTNEIKPARKCRPLGSSAATRNKTNAKSTLQLKPRSVYQRMRRVIELFPGSIRISPEGHDSLEPPTNEKRRNGNDIRSFEPRASNGNKVSIVGDRITISATTPPRLTISNATLEPTTMTLGFIDDNGIQFDQTQHKSISTEQIRDACHSSLPDGGNRLTTVQRTEFITKVTKVLFLTEFVLLVEFTEVLAPVIYAIYLWVIAHLPNRAYYPLIADLSSTQVTDIAKNVLVYALLEAISFTVICAVFYRMLQISPIHHVAFVLEHNMRLVQSNLLLWVIYIVQSSLVHQGVDFSFQFAWLHGKTP